MVYRWNVVFFSLLALLPALVGIYLWGVVFKSRNDPEITRRIATYYVVAAFVGWRIAQYQWQVMFEVREGRMATEMLRPISYPAKLFWYEVGGRTWSTLITLPVFAVLAILLGDNFQAPSGPWPWLLAILAFVVAYVLNFFITAALGLVTVWQNQPEGFFALYGACSQVLGGVSVPLALMPGGVGDWLQWLPFAYIYSLPIRIFQGLPAGQILQGFAVQLGWLLLAVLLFKWVWRNAVRRYEVFEG